MSSPLFSINHHNGVPAYRQIMDQVKLQIAAGALREGAELPSTRALSVDLQLNPMTVSKAYGLLEREGVLERRRGQTLTVRMPAGGEDPAQRERPLRTQLEDAAALAAKLNITPARALELFRDILNTRIQ